MFMLFCVGIKLGLYITEHRSGVMKADG